MAPSTSHADIIVPRARDNEVAIEMVAMEIARRVEAATERALETATAASAASSAPGK